MTSTTPFWVEDHPPPPSLGQDDLPATADVVVVGAGVTGLAAARRLAAAGRSVAVIDAGPIGGGASRVSGGMVVYGLKEGEAKLAKQYGTGLARELWDASLASIDLVEEIAVGDGVDCEFERTGSVELGLTEGDLPGFREESEWLQRELGFDVEYFGPDRIHEVAGSDLFTGALLDRVSAGVHPAKFAIGLGSVTARAGAALVEATGVTALERAGAGYEVRTSRGVVRAGDVLLATNGYTDSLMPALRRRVVPIGSYIVVTEPLPGATAARLIPGRRMLWTSRRFLNYFRLTGDNRLMLGGRRNLSTELDLQDSARALRDRIVEIYPELKDAAITHVWSGRLGATFDLLPHIGRFDGVWHALGYSGHGMGLGTYLGHEVAGLITGDLERSPFAEIRFPGRWFYRKRPWFLPAGAVLFRVLDRLGR
jgi:glycine/D-amino acid oxidase-like deaminating enzyme